MDRMDSPGPMPRAATDAARTDATVWRFPPFELRPAERRLLRDGDTVKLVGRAFDLLVALVERRERVVPKAELLDLVWPHLVVEENNLQVHVLALRRLLGPQAIGTVPGRGYRFTAPLLDAPAAVVAATASTGRPPLDQALVGRDHDLRELDAALHAHRLVTLLGAGGVGKSTLARVVADAGAARFAAGATWVDLSLAAHDTGVADSVATALQVVLARGERVPALVAALADWHGLLVLDNAEHLLDGVAALAKALHAGTKHLHVLVTSQAPLRLAAEQLYRLEPLALPEPMAALADAADSAAVRLFVRRVRASDRHFVLDAHNLRAVVNLTRRLDGLPLAIEMAAARVPALSPAQLDAALDQRFRLLTAGDRTVPARQHSLQAAMRWTHDQLGVAERVVFQRLAVFVGGFTLPAAQHVCRDDDVPIDGGIDEWQVVDALSVLVDRSLVVLPQGEPPRYRLLDTPQAFGRRLLADAGEETRVRGRHLTFFCARFGAAFEDHLWVRQSAADQLRQTTADADNGLAALNHALAHDPESAIALLPGLAQALVRRHPDRFAAWQRTEPLISDALPAPVRARWQLGFAQFWGQNSLRRSQPHALAAAALFRAEGHAAGEYRACAIVGGQLQNAPGDAWEPALVRMRELEDPAWPAELRYLRSWAEGSRLIASGRYLEALAYVAYGDQLQSESGRGGRLVHDMAMMYVQIMAGRLDAAIARGQASIERLRPHQRQGLASGTEVLLLVAWLLKGDTGPARALGPAVWAAGAVFNQQGAVAETLCLLAALEGRPHAAMLLFGFAEAAYGRDGTQRLAAYQSCGERAIAAAAATLAAHRIEALRRQGSELPPSAIPALAFATADWNEAMAAPGTLGVSKAGGVREQPGAAGGQARSA